MPLKELIEHVPPALVSVGDRFILNDEGFDVTCCTTRGKAYAAEPSRLACAEFMFINDNGHEQIISQYGIIRVVA